MGQLSPSLRKAAVLISALDENAAEALLAHMGAEQAAKVRSAVVEIDDVSPEEQERVLAEFFEPRARRSEEPKNQRTKEVRGAKGQFAGGDDDVSLDLDPVIEEQAGAKSGPTELLNEPLDSTKPEPGPLAFLQHVPAPALATLLSREQPQTVAVVVGRLAPEQAASVLEQLPASLATEALERMAWLDQLAPDVEQDLARQLRQQLAPQLAASDARGEGVGRLSAVLGAMDFRQRQRVVMRLGERNATLLRRLGLSADASALNGADSEVVAFRYRLESEGQSRSPSITRERKSTSELPQLSFDDLTYVDDAGLRAVFAAVHPQVVLLALTGADRRLVARVLSKLPGPEAAVLRGRLEQPGPLRLREIERAQEELSSVATQLARQGLIRLPSGVRFAAAV
jgi:flagellar motor switch protein FliG